MTKPLNADLGVSALLFEKLGCVLVDADENTAPDRLVEEVLASLAESLRRRFWNEHLREEAAISACKSMLRRFTEGQYHDQGPEFLAQILLKIAANKARKLLRLSRREQAGLIPGWALENAVSEREILEDKAEKEREVNMVQIAGRMIRQLRAALKNKLHRQIFDHFVLQMSGINQRTRQEIAAKLGCSVQTVRRVWKNLNSLWEIWTKDAQHELHALDAELT